MEFLTKKHMSRRTVLRGLGVGGPPDAQHTRTDERSG